jgi:hypothetical protein
VGGVSQECGSRGHDCELFAELRELGAQSQPPIPLDFKSARPFGGYLAGHKATLRALFGATDRTAGGWQAPLDL